MSTALRKYEPKSLTRKSAYTTNYVTILILGTIIIYLILKVRQSANKIDKLATKIQYNNESVSVVRDERGRIAGLEINRSAH